MHRPPIFPLQLLSRIKVSIQERREQLKGVCARSNTKEKELNNETEAIPCLSTFIVITQKRTAERKTRRLWKKPWEMAEKDGNQTEGNICSQAAWNQYRHPGPDP